MTIDEVLDLTVSGPAGDQIALRNVVSSRETRGPLVIERLTYLVASAIVLVAALASALVVRRRVNRLDLVGVLKTRD